MEESVSQNLSGQKGSLKRAKSRLSKRLVPGCQFDGLEPAEATRMAWILEVTTGLR
jgi:hypothetical protein